MLVSVTQIEIDRFILLAYLVPDVGCHSPEGPFGRPVAASSIGHEIWTFVNRFQFVVSHVA